ncbi:MAG: tRNA (guanosine(46)-N7)-methyltransferase TrmB [Cyclobacteriaceae bacterium]|nr:tRNA (guanosine(46)-N7)-methyltransferase TrmB [Cyclobacteriaceae bacterium]
MRGKKNKFAENLLRDNVIEPGKTGYKTLQGKWASDFFRNTQPITLELACGWGEYTLGLSRLFNDRNFIGVDIKGDRLWKGSGIALEEDLKNAAFLRTQIEHLMDFFGPGEVSEIWLMFPDPRPKKRDAKRRITHSRFLDVYKQIISPGGLVRLKTDNTGLFEYSLEVLQAREDICALEYSFDLYSSDYSADCYDIVTKYEKKFREAGEVIKYLQFRYIN